MIHTCDDDVCRDRDVNLQKVPFKSRKVRTGLSDRDVTN